MITSGVRQAFRRLAASEVIELAKEHADNPTDPQGVDAMLNALAGADEAMMEKINKAYDTDQVERVRAVITRFYQNVNVPSSTQKAVESDNTGHVLGILRQMLDDAMQGLGEAEQAPGFREELAGLKSKGVPTAELDEFIERMYASQIPRMAEAYLHTKTPGNIAKMEALRRQGLNPKAEAVRLVRTLLFESTKRMILADPESKQSFVKKDSDAMAYNTPPANVQYAIDHRNTRDQFDEQLPTGARTIRKYYLVYVRPVIDSFQSARGGVDTVGLTEWLNEEFHGTGEPGEEVTATTPDGQLLTAPVRKKKFDIHTVQQWAQSAMQTQSLDAPVGGDEDSISRAEMVADDKLTTWEEDEKIKYYTENRKTIRKAIAEYIDAAAAEVSISDAEQWRPALRQAMRIKFGFEFEKEWRREILSTYGTPAKFYMEAMPSAQWVAIGRPKKKHWNQVRNPAWVPGKKKKGEDKEKKWIFSQEEANKSEFRTYKKDWAQKGLWDKKNEKWADSLPATKDYEDYEVRDWKHKVGEEAFTPHFVNYYEYTPKQWAKDMAKAESNYDGQSWVDSLIGEELKKDLESQGLTRVHKIGPEKLLQAYSTHLDKQLMRALGFNRVTVSPQPNTLYSGNNTFTPGMKAMMRLFWEKARNNEDVWGYLAYKREGKVASLDMARTIRLAVDSLTRKAG